MFSDCFDILISKIILKKNNNNNFNVFSNKKHFQPQIATSILNKS